MPADPSAEDGSAPKASPVVATSEELRRAALARSAQRNTQVARRRLRARWVVFGLYKLSLWTLPLLILVELSWALWWREHPLPARLQTLVNGPAAAAGAQAKSPSAPGPTPRGEP
ncbi:hypothetical protein [Ideonella sp. YS5]|uniref:hypothetical protein n=1 Tax=Ideonella sp. YS5 TaxID=3453714 RepID=UPI003EE823DA